MGKRYKEKQLVAQAGRRRAVLQIDRVSRREVNEAPVRVAPTKREVNPNSVTGIGLLGAYGEDSSDEEERGDQVGTDNSIHSSAPETNEAQPRFEMDAKLADFFKEIESIDPDATPSSTEGQMLAGTQGFSGDISSTTEPDLSKMQRGNDDNSYAEHFEEQRDGQVPYPWQVCYDENTHYPYYWNTETNEVRWEPPPMSVSDVAATGDSDVQYGPDMEKRDDSGEAYGPSLPDSCSHNEVSDNEPAIGPSLPPDITKPEELPDSQAEEDSVAVSSGFPLVEYQDAEDNSYPATPPDIRDADSDGNEVVDGTSREELFDNEAIDGVPMEEPEGREEKNEGQEISATKADQMEEQDSDDEFAAMLLEDTYHKGKNDTVNDDLVLQEDTNDVNGIDSDSEGKPLLPPLVFEHLKATSSSDKTRKQEQKALADEKLSTLAEEKELEEQEEKLRQEIIDLSALITNKLDFLEISRKRISHLEILRIEMETRIRDWREGGLSSSHLVRKLEEAKLHFQHYEESASPPGWTCKWHRYGTHLLFTPVR